SAALADIGKAQQKVSASFSVTTLNQTIAGSAALALDTKLTDLETTLQSAQLDQLGKTTQAVATLRQQLQTQLHLAQLNLANSSLLAQSLQQQQAVQQELFG